MARVRGTSERMAGSIGEQIIFLIRRYFRTNATRYRGNAFRDAKTNFM